MIKKRILYLIIAITMTIGSFLGITATSFATESDESIRNVVENYMSGRLMLLQGGETMELSDTAVSGIVTDELLHRKCLEEARISVFCSEYEICNIDIFDRNVYVTVLETITYLDNRIMETREVEHKILMIESATRGWVVLSDEYCEDISEFVSCSYVTEVSTYGLARGLTYSLEILNVAAGEVGYVEKATNENLYEKTTNAGSEDYTKYGEWYGCNGQPWCAMFVSWCANEAGVRTCIVPRYSSCDRGMEKFEERGVFYEGPAHGTTFIPQEGDIFFWGVVGDATHTGIVASVNTIQNTMVVIDGNHGNMVAQRIMSYTNTSLLGFARPRYSSSHMYELKYNITYHWSACSVCGVSTTQKIHTYSSLGKCTLCGATKASVSALSINRVIE